MYYIGVDVGGMSIKAGVMTKDGLILAKGVVTTRVYDDKISVSEDIHTAIQLALSKADIDISAIDGIGIGHPGSIDSAGGIIRYSNNIALTNVPVISELHKYYDLPIFINNDANCAALGEYMFGSGKGFSDIVFVTLGTGVGSGIIINNILFEGKECAGAEAGHTVIVSGGNECNCGRRGCWETYASVTGLIKQTKAAMDKDSKSLMHAIAKEEGKVSGKTSFIAAKAGDATANAVVKQYMWYISEGLINLANIFRPDVIIIGGGISYEGAYLTDKLNEDMSTLTYGSKYNPSVKVVTASLANDAGILGAGALCLM